MSAPGTSSISGFPSLGFVTPSTTADDQEGGADEEDEGETVDRRKKQRSKVWDHFTLVTKYGKGQGLWQCHECGEDDIAARLNSTSNLLSHAQLRCPKVLAMISGNPRDNNQATLGGFNVVIPPITKSRFIDMIVEWVAVAGLPFTTVGCGLLRDIFKFLHPDALLPSADTISRKFELA